MKPFVLAVCFALSAIALADDANPPDNVTVIPGPGGHTRRGGKRLDPDSTRDTSNTIRGRCIVEENAANPLPGPCVNLLLILNDLSGKEVDRARTTPQGKFEFSADNSKTYRIVPGSRFYIVSSPKDPIPSGQNVDLVLQQKP